MLSSIEFKDIATVSSLCIGLIGLFKGTTVGTRIFAALVRLFKKRLCGEFIWSWRFYTYN